MKHCLGGMGNPLVRDVSSRFDQTTLSSLWLALILSIILCSSGHAQDQGPPAGDTTNVPNATSLLAQMFAAFSSETSVDSVELKGSATWHSGSLDDNGTVTLSATSAGSGQVQFSFNKKGSWVETQVPVTSNCVAQSSNSEPGTSNRNITECLRPLVWFLPQISLQPKALAPGIVVSDHGIGRVGAISDSPYRHFQSKWTFTNTSDSLVSQVIEDEAIDVGLDPQSFLPVVISYKVHPDDGSQAILIPIEVHFSNYQKIGGAEIPFLIQRYVNGSLQLEIKVDTAVIN